MRRTSLTPALAFLAALLVASLTLAQPAAPVSDAGPAAPDSGLDSPEQHAGGGGADYAGPPPGARLVDDGWFAPPEPQGSVPLPSEPTRIFVLPVRERITDKTFSSLKRKALRCIAAGADLIIVDIDTWGGDAIAALDISRLMKVELKDIHVLCYVRTRAISAGAMIACACDQIIMAPSASFGDCAPIALGGKLEGVEREKIETVVRRDFADSAERNGYNIPLAESMVTITREVWLVRNLDTRELRFVNADDWRNKVVSPDATSASAPAPDLATAAARSQRRWEFLRAVVRDNELLTMGPRQAVEYGFAGAVIDFDTDRPYARLLESVHAQGQPTVLADTWSEDVVDFLTHPAVLGFLLFLGVLCAYVEMHTPGFGVAGTVAIVCFAVFFGAPFLAGLAQWWEIALVIVGLILLIVEIFFIPGFGVTGVLGIICILAGLVALAIPGAGFFRMPDSALARSWFANVGAAIALGFIGAFIAGAILSRFLPRLPGANRLFLAPIPYTPTAPAPDDSPVHHISVGDTGTVEATCRPIGKVRFGDDLLDAESEGDVIPPGARVRVIRRSGTRIVVERTA